MCAPLHIQAAAETQADFALASGDKAGASAALTSFSAQHCARFLATYATLFTTMVRRCARGCVKGGSMSTVSS
jgi:hypothetical protein